MGGITLKTLDQKEFLCMEVFGRLILRLVNVCHGWFITGDFRRP